MQNGSKTVMIGDQEVMLKDQSFYKSSPLGDEAATNSFGANVISHVITGKTYFVAWSMDVQFEGQNVDRHLDLTMSNNASAATTTAPGPGVSKPTTPGKPKQCDCCGGDAHAAGPSMSMNDWYEQKNAKLPDQSDDPNQPSKQGMRDLLKRASPEGRKEAGCTCDKLVPKGKKRTLTPEPPCDKFYVITKEEKKKIDEQWSAYSPKYKQAQGIPTYADQVESMKAAIDARKKLTRKQQQRLKARIPPEDDRKLMLERQVNHLVPRSAGGCPGKPGKDGNLQNNKDLCPVCQGIDEQFSKYQ
jgi:hypothetical protein